jgi:hypothetical protein
MTTYRLFLFSFLTVLWIFLSGFNKPIANAISTQDIQKTELELQSIETKNTRKMQQRKSITISVADTGMINKNLVKADEFDKTLDLSVPFRESENNSLKNKQKLVIQGQMTNMFAPETEKNHEPLELNGDLLMSPEPEVGKQKTVDGAGFVIKLKP